MIWNISSNMTNPSFAAFKGAFPIENNRGQLFALRERIVNGLDFFFLAYNR